MFPAFSSLLIVNCVALLYFRFTILQERKKIVVKWITVIHSAHHLFSAKYRTETYRLYTYTFMDTAELKKGYRKMVKYYDKQKPVAN